MVAGPDPGWCLAVDREPRSVGRDPACDLTLVDPRLSRRHLEVRSRRGVVEVRDLGSANGTRVRRARRSVLRRGRSGWASPGRPLGARWRTVTLGSDVLLGGSVIRVRLRPGLDPAGGRPAWRRVGARARLPGGPGAAGPGLAPAGTAPASAPAPRPGTRSTRWAASLLLAVSSLPLLLASGASGGRLALFAAVPVLLALAGSAVGRAPRASTPRPADPAAVLVAAAAGGGLTIDGTDRPADGGTGSWLVSTAGDGVLDPFAEGPVALVGEPAATEAAARWLVCQLAVAHPPSALRIDLPPPPSWWWAQELPHAAGIHGRTSGAPDRPTAAGDRQGPRTLVVEAGGRSRPSRGESPAHHAAGSATALVALVRTVADVPVRCRRVIEVSPQDHQVSADWAWHVVTSLALHATTTGTAMLPSDVAITPMLADPFLAWAKDDGRLAAAFTHDGDGPLEVDLAREGPHALVAGTTGSGKSELLLCWVLALACRYPPSALTIVAIDYKGGATFGPLAGLPHLAGVLTDLDGAGTARALAGLQAELERRERRLAAAGARDLPAYRRAVAASKGLRTRRGVDGEDDGDREPLAPLGRLLVVVDEFRVLAEEHPDLMAGLVRTAAQGRSLGIHLVLATQRPAGALSADLRANLTVSLCLRVLTPADSHDVIGSGDAAALPPVPGRAILHGGHRRAASAGPPGAVTVQAAWSGPEDAVRQAVQRAAAAADRSGERSAEPLWAPPLPARAVASSAVELTTTGASDSLPIMLVDRPAERRPAEWAWVPGLAPLLLAGSPGTGRTTALQTVAAAALGRGWAVHVAHGGEPAAWAAVHGLRDHPGLGTMVGADDPRRLVRLLDLLQDSRGPAILCVDDVDAVAAACDRMSGPAGTERLGRLLRDGRARGLGVAVAGPLAVLGSRWAEVARHRIVLGPLDSGQAALAGVPRAVVLDRPVAGRAVLIGDGPPVHAQVLLPAARLPAAHPPREDRAAPRLRVLPLHPCAEDVRGQQEPAAHDARAAPRGLDAVPLGLGDDHAGVILLELPAGARVVVAGPPESGRTSALRWIGESLQQRGRRHVGVAPGMPGTDAGSDATVLVDDADLLGQEDADAVVRCWRDHPGAVVVAARSAWLATGYGALVGLLRGARTVLLLGPLRGGCAHLSGADVLSHADPAAPRHPGRGVLVGPRRCVPIQLPAPPAPVLSR